MDVTPYLEPRIAPRAIFDALPVRANEPRFMVPTGNGWQPVTWAAFADDIRRIALFLRARGLRPGDTAAIFAQNCVEWMAAAMGIQAAGGVMVPIYAASTPAQARYVVEHSEARFLFVDTRERAVPGVEHVVLLSDDHDDRAVGWSRATADGELDLDAVDLDQPALMLYTSGTTGDPKGVPLTHRNIAENWRDWFVCNASLLDEGAIDLLWLPFSHIFGFGEACLGNTLGFTSYLSDPKQVLEHMPQVKPTVFMSVPAYWEKIAAAAASPDPEARREKLREVTGGRLRFCLSGGAGLKREVKELFYECGVLIIEGYGLTECSPTLTLNRPDSFRFDSVGKPLPSVEIKLAEDGEILARGPNIFSGYHKNRQATREAFTSDGWFKTGDVGRFTDDGFLQIIDRKKEILVTAGGKNVPPANIELRFADDPLFRHVVVYGDGKNYLTAGVWLAPEAYEMPDIEAVVHERIERMNQELASFERIRRHRIMKKPLTVENGLLTSTLKLRRKLVYQAFRDEFESLYA